MIEKLPEGTLSMSGTDIQIAYAQRSEAERAFAIIETMLYGPPKTFISMSRKISELDLALVKAEATIRNQQIEIDRLGRQIIEAKSQGYKPAAISL
jgi:hypothetical protein